MENQSWPVGRKKTLSQPEHKAWNSSHYPGTRQLCIECEAPTGRREEDSMFTEEGHGPLCEECFNGLTTQEDEELNPRGGVES